MCPSRNTVKTFFAKRHVQNLTFDLATFYRPLIGVETTSCVYIVRVRVFFSSLLAFKADLPLH